MALHELIYVSDAAYDMAPQELNALLVQARAKNARLEVTGILVHYRRHFMQLLEGEKATVLALFDEICRDPRHRNVMNVWDHGIEARNFAEWSMAFVTPDELQLRRKSGYSDFLERGLDAPDKGSVGRRLLLRLRDEVLRTA